MLVNTGRKVREQKNSGYSPRSSNRYATIFTSGPVISLVLDEDVSETNALKFPELYRELQKRRYLSLKTFLSWAWKALYQVRPHHHPWAQS